MIQADAAARAGIPPQIPQGGPGGQPPAEGGASAKKGRAEAAVGQQAKAAVAAAIDAGIAVPKNAQGLAASSIARGADPAALFASRVETGGDAAPDAGAGGSDPVAADPGDYSTASGEDPADGTASAAPAPQPQTDPAIARYADALSATAPAVVSGAEAALQLLQKSPE